MPRSSLRAGAACAVVLAACGGSSGPAGPLATCRLPPAPPPPSAASGFLSAQASSGLVTSAGATTFTVLATGPAQYRAPCDNPLTMVVVDRTDLHVYESAPLAAPRGVPCGAVRLRAGQQAEYALQWRPDETLPGGAYRVVLGVGDQPPLVLTVEVGTVFGCRG